MLQVAPSGNKRDAIETVTTTTRQIELPESLAVYFQRYLNIARYQRCRMRADPDVQITAQLTPKQELFLCGIAQAFHNLAEPDGVAFFYSEAKRINSTWAPHVADLLADDRIGWMKQLTPLPEHP